MSDTLGRHFVTMIDGTKHAGWFVVGVRADIIQDIVLLIFLVAHSQVSVVACPDRVLSCAFRSELIFEQQSSKL